MSAPDLTPATPAPPGADAPISVVVVTFNSADAVGRSLPAIVAELRDGDELLPLLRDADFVSLHAPLTEATRGLIGSTELAGMKQTAYLINTARGDLVDQEALREALELKLIAGAGLDVTTPEPLPPEHPLLGAPNLVVLPHIGSASTSARVAMARLAAGNLIAALAGDAMPNGVFDPAA